MSNDRNLNDILSQRSYVPPSTNLAARIIAAAEIRKDTPLIFIIIEEILAMLVIPKPAYALAFCLIFGLAVGLQLYTDTSTLDQDWFTFFDVEEGDWL